jgi:hypothetical protein
MEKESSITVPDTVELGMSLPENEVLLVEHISPEQDILAFEIMAIDEEPYYRAPDFVGGQEVTVEEANMMLTEKLSNAGRTLDAARDAVSNDNQASEWLELKKVVAATKIVADIYDKFDLVEELWNAVYEFTQELGVDCVYS